MQRLFIVRHGQSVANAQKRVTGWQESPLTALGKKQSRQAGDAAKLLQIDLIISSPMVRAQETAAIIADSIGYAVDAIITMPELKERGFGELEGTDCSHNPRLNGDFIETEQIPSAEPIRHFYDRVQKGLQHLKNQYPQQCILIVCHQNVGRMLQVVAKGQPPLQLYEQPLLKNATIVPLA